jgi:hypothetical protein
VRLPEFPPLVLFVVDSSVKRAPEWKLSMPSRNVFWDAKEASGPDACPVHAQCHDRSDRDDEGDGGRRHEPRPNGMQSTEVRDHIDDRQRDEHGNDPLEDPQLTSHSVVIEIGHVIAHV